MAHLLAIPGNSMLRSERSASSCANASKPVLPRPYGIKIYVQDVTETRSVTKAVGVRSSGRLRLAACKRQPRNFQPHFSQYRRRMLNASAPWRKRTVASLPLPRVVVRKIQPRRFVSADRDWIPSLIVMGSYARAKWYI